jgi:hypothetical protein
MADPVEFQIAYIYPTDREGRTIALRVQHEGSVDMPVEVWREDGETVISLYAGTEGLTYRMEDFRAAVDAAVAALEGPPPDWSKATP